MNALVASVIRTYTPTIVGALAGWLIMIHIPVLPELEVLLTAVVGALLTMAYYTVVRVLEQQWPGFGVLLGLTASPDTYSKGNDTPAETAKQTSLADTAVNAPATGAGRQGDGHGVAQESPATTFPKAAVDAAEATQVPALADVEPAPVVSAYTAPVA